MRIYQMKNKLTIEELKILVFEKKEATKQNKDKLFKLAKATNNLQIIEELAEKYKYKNAIKYLEKLSNITLEKALKDRNIQLLKNLANKNIDFSNISLSDLIANNYSIEFIEFFIDTGADVNAFSSEGFPPLTKASFVGNEKICQLLIDEGADPSQQDVESATPLIIASQQGYYAIVKILLDSGADINFQSNMAITALFQASAYGRDEIVSLLISKGANVNIENYEGATPLVIAAQNNHIVICRQLIKAGADINHRMKNGYSALMLPSQNGMIEIISMFIEYGIDIDMQDKDGDTPLLIASKNGFIDIVKLLINHNADIDHQNKNGDTALTLASYRNHQEIVKLLLDAKANPNIQANDGSTALSFALQNNNKGLISLLIKSDAYKLPKLDKMNEMWDGICAQGNEATELVEVLIKNGADINFRSSNGNTPLITAANYGHLEIVEILIKNGAVLDCQNVVGLTALHISAMRKFINIVKVLLEAGADTNIQDYEDKMTPLGRIILHRTNRNDITATTSYIKEKNDTNVQMVKLLLKYKADPNILNQYDSSSLITSSRIGDQEIVELLLDAKARRDIQENTGLTALMGASHANHLEVCKKLIEHGADVNYTSTHNQSTALSAAIENNNLEIAKLLILEGADPYHESQATINGTPFGVHPNDIRHGNALQLAQEFGFTEIEQFLKNHMQTIEENNEIPKGHIVLQNNLSIDVYSKYIILKSQAGDEKSEIRYNKVDKNKYKNEKKGYFYIVNISHVKKETIAGDTRKYKIESHTGNILELNNSHNPKALSSLLKKFSSDERLKYTNHSWDVDEFYYGQSLDYDTFRKYLVEGWSEIKDDLKNLSLSQNQNLYKKIDSFLFDENKISFSFIEVKKALQNSKKPETILLENGTTFQDKMNDFKGLIVIKQNDKKLKLLKIFTKLRQELNLSIKLNLDDLKEDKIDKFFTDVDRFKQGLKIILKDIESNADEDKKNVSIKAQEVDNMIEIKIIHNNSRSSKTAQQLSKTINENGGNFKIMHENLVSLCDWSIDTICQDGNRYKIDFLYPEIDNDKPHYEKIDDTIEGFTHILRFYK